MTHAFVTVVVPFLAGRERQVNDFLDRLGNVAGCGKLAKPPRAEALSDATLEDLAKFVHFMSMVVIPEDGGPSAFLVIEVCADGEPRFVLQRLVRKMTATLRDVIEKTGNEIPPGHSLGSYLEAHRIEVGTGRFAETPGLEFTGTPEMAVKRILNEARLAERIRTLIRAARVRGSALDMLNSVRSAIFRDARLKWAFVSEPVRLLDDAQPRLDLFVSVFVAAWRDFFWVLLPAPPLVGFASAYFGSPIDTAIWHMVIALGIELLVVGAALVIGYLRLRRQEKDDVPWDVEPGKGRVRRIMARENQPGVAQNHLWGISILKPGLVRHVSLRVALWVIGELARGSSRPGFLNKIGTIHFARWMLLPGTDRLVFLSNYDGSWQSYLEDFIARLREGLTSVWSNTRDFPRTANLFVGGADDGARFKRWARRQQQPTRFWYSAYPQLTTSLIRTNAAIRHGFASASSESEAAKWLALFGYAAPETVEKEEIPTLVFGGLGRLRYSHCLLLQLGDSESSRKWLRSIDLDAGYGEQKGSEAQVVAFTSGGMRKLGLDAAALGTFPTAFQHGMAAPERARPLGDFDTHGWWWGGPLNKQVDAALILYSDSKTGLKLKIRESVAYLAGFGHSVVYEVKIKKVPSDQNEIREPFGFRDGISQPVMRGAKNWSRRENEMHVVEPGELVLGYHDNLRNLNPSPHSKGLDIGRNGTYLVVRQLEQHTAGFDAYLDRAARRLDGDQRVPADLPTRKHWIAARMVGRWKDGSSLLRNPDPPAPHSPPSPPPAPRRPDNDFRFGREDPDGLRCPLGAHVRRANPRESFEPDSSVQLAITNRHRILRVGRVYEPPAGEKNPGLLFMCINADIERQFEFLQQTWLLGSNFHGLDDEIDPVVGYRSRRDAMTVPTSRGPVRLQGLAKFVTMRGGAYFFIPGKSTMRRLASARPPWTW
jgi:deferrochelatase/peroxidase EfeB